MKAGRSGTAYADYNVTCVITCAIRLFILAFFVDFLLFFNAVSWQLIKI